MGFPKLLQLKVENFLMKNMVKLQINTAIKIIIITTTIIIYLR